LILQKAAYKFFLKKIVKYRKIKDSVSHSIFETDLDNKKSRQKKELRMVKKKKTFAKPFPIACSGEARCISDPSGYVIYLQKIARQCGWHG